MNRKIITTEYNVALIFSYNEPVTLVMLIINFHSGITYKYKGIRVKVRI